MSHFMKMLEATKDYAPDVIDKAKDYAPKIVKAAKDKLPSNKQMDHLHMKWDAKVAEELMKAMPKRVKRFEITKMILLPVAAAAAALLFAPKSGKELRADIKDYFMDLKEEGMDAYNEAKAELQEEDSSDSGSNSESSQNYSSAEEDPAAGVGDVKGTPYEPHEDQTVPANQLEEALEDVGVESVDELDNKP